VIEIEILDLHRGDNAKRVIDLQRAAYRVESELISFSGIPYLFEEEEELLKSEEVLLAYWEDDHLLGVLSYEQVEYEIEICRLVVKPEHFQRGIASSLLTKVQEEITAGQITVKTAKANKPAIRLYKKFGYHLEQNFATKEGLELVELIKRIG